MPSFFTKPFRFFDFTTSTEIYALRHNRRHSWPCRRSRAAAAEDDGDYALALQVQEELKAASREESRRRRAAAAAAARDDESLALAVEFQEKLNELWFYKKNCLMLQLQNQKEKIK
jgi:hypothetical protein